MKKILLTLLILGIFNVTVLAKEDKFSEDYLKNTKHFSILNPLAESFVEHGIKSELKKETGAKFKVKFDGYTLGSMKKGIFKNLEITGKDVEVEDIIIPYVHLKSISDYNYIDYTKDPIVFKSDMKFDYDILLSQDSINKALKHGDYQSVLNTINDIAYPLFQVKGVSTKIVNNRLYFIIEYNFPIALSTKNKVFVTSSEFEVKNGKIKAVNIKLDSAYGNISLSKVGNMLNLLNPLEFTMQLLETKNCDAKIENVKIIDNKVKINGKIFVEGE